MKKLLLCLGLMALLTQSVLAFRPSGWVYINWPWAFESATGDWHWFNTPDTQWVCGFPPADGWRRIHNSDLATGWSFHGWPYVYCPANASWYYVNEVDRQWVVNMRTGAWSRFGIPASMVRIPGGTNVGTDPDSGAYRLTVDSFCMDKYEVTKALWDEVYTWATGHGYEFDNPGSGKDANHPVHSVSWYDVVRWCNARSEKEGRPAVYTVNGAVFKTGQSNDVVQAPVAGYRLPTDVEWEYAARGGVASHRFPWNDSDEIQHARANYYSESSYGFDTSSTRGYHPAYNTGERPYTSPAGSFAPNGYGLYDMAGNVWEWCFDWHPSYVDTYRVMCGGSWAHIADFCRDAYRNADSPEDHGNAMGFRTVLPLGQQ